MSCNTAFHRVREERSENNGQGFLRDVHLDFCCGEAIVIAEIEMQRYISIETALNASKKEK